MRAYRSGVSLVKSDLAGVVGLSLVWLEVVREEPPDVDR